MVGGVVLDQSMPEEALHLQGLEGPGAGGQEASDGK